MNEENEQVNRMKTSLSFILKLLIQFYISIWQFCSSKMTYYNKSALRNLPGVVHDEEELTEVLKKYTKKIIKNSEDILQDLRKISQDCKQKEFERVHFHFSGER